jgi:hypothetical protein
MSPLHRRISRLRWFLAAHRALSAGARALLAVSLLLCAVALALKTASDAPPAWLVAAALALPILVALPTLRKFTLARAAVELDRTLRLDERLSTSLEARGAFADAQRRDAERELERADVASVKRLRLPREIYFSGACALVLIATLIAPMPAESGSVPEADPADRAALTRAAEAIRNVDDRGSADVRKIRQDLAKRIAETLADPLLKEKLLSEISRDSARAREELEGGGLSAAERAAWKELLEALEAAGGAVSTRVRAQAARRLMGPDEATLRKLDRAARGEVPPIVPLSNVGGEEIPRGMPVAVYSEKVRTLLADPPWDGRYSNVVSGFYGQ